MFRRKGVKIFNVPDWSDTTTKTYDLTTFTGREQVPINLDEIKDICFIYVRENNEYYRLISDTTSGTTRTLVFDGSKTITITKTNTTMTVVFSAGTTDIGVTDTTLTLSGVPADAKATGDAIDEINDDLAEKADALNMLKAFPTKTVSGSIASFTDGVDNIPVKSLIVAVKALQTGSGDPSPTNVRPITGWSGIEVTVSPTMNIEDGETYNITFPSEAGTVYGGSLNVTTGVLTVDMAMVDMGTLNWVYYSEQQRFVVQVNSAKPAGSNIGLEGACSVYKVVNTPYRLAPDKSIVIGNNFISNFYAAMVVHDEGYTDADTFKSSVSGQMLIFPIKTAKTYQLTPIEVVTLLGTNNVLANTGDSTVEYRANINMYIDEVFTDYRTMIAPVETTYIATTNYTVGQLLIVGNTLYKVTANIANGNTIAPNTNVTATTISEVISTL